MIYFDFIYFMNSMSIEIDLKWTKREWIEKTSAKAKGSASQWGLVSYLAAVPHLVLSLRLRLQS